MRFKFTGSHPDDLASGRPLAFGEVVHLSRQEQAANERLIEGGLLIPMPQAPRRKRNTTQEDEE